MTIHVSILSKIFSLMDVFKYLLINEYIASYSDIN